jgi:glycopeptide antibiotics resistance protein
MKNLIKLCFLGYMGILFYLLFFSAYRHSVEGIVSYNLIPFKTIILYFQHFNGLALTDQFVGNILAFVPFGFLLPLIFSRSVSFLRIFGYSLLLSLTVEVAQLLFRVGAFDVDDLILNGLGGIVGYWLVKLVELTFWTKGED